MTVIVIGGGLAGLTAATRLTAQGIASVVLEARPGVGGRMQGIEVAPGAWADAGAAYLGHRHTALKAMLAECGLATVPTAMAGDSRFALGGAPVRSPGRFPPLRAVALGEMFDLLDELTRQIDVAAPWLTPDAARLDTTTAAAWADAHLAHPDARLFFPLFLGEMMAADPARISVLHMAFYLRSGGGIRYLNAFEGGAQAERIDGGAHALCEALAARLGDRVRLSTPVHAIDQDGDRVIVHTARGPVEGSAAIVALAPLLADRLAYTPALPARRASPHTAPGCAVKVHLVYPTPLWRDRGLSGWSVSSDGPMLSTVDDSPPDGRAGILTGFVTGAEAQQFARLSRDDQRAAVLAQARRLFPELPAPRSCHVTDWINAEYSRGCYAALFGPGDWLRLGPSLTQPHGRVHWAGTETSLEFFGLMEGAIRSGYRAAGEVAALPPPRTTIVPTTLARRDLRAPGGNDMNKQSPIAPLEARRKMMVEPTLGAGSFLDHALERNPNREVPFLYKHHTDRQGRVVLTGYSLVELQAIRTRYARWYWANGVRAGDPVGVWVAEGTEPLLHFLALTSIGAIPALLNDAMPIVGAKRYLDHVGIVGLVCDDPTAIAAAYRADVQRRPRFIVATAEVRAYDTASALPPVYPHRHQADEIVGLIHSSGTTGTPKSTMLAHRQFWVGKEPRMVRFPAEDYDRLLCIMPHTHAGGLSYFLTATLLGLPMVAAGGWRREVIEPVMLAFQPTMVASFPRSFVELATGELPTAAAAKVHSWFNTGDSAHYGHIRRLVQLGERPAGLVRPWLLPEEKSTQPALPGSQFVDGLGSSEMGMALFGELTTPETPRNDRCIGKPIAIVERAAVLDETGRELPDGAAGMLGVRTPTRTPGYWNDPQLTRSFELAGYWLTGDIARRDSDGRYYHLDRTVDVIDTVAGPVYSLPLEEVLLADCAELIVDCVVVGVPSPSGGQVPVANVRLQPGVKEPSVEDLLAHANHMLRAARLTPLATLVIARTPEDYPQGVTGKALKREMRTRLAGLLTGAR